LTFEKATDEPNFSEMYALFCRKIMETIDPNITDPTVLNKDGQPLTGGQLFRKYLLNRCQEEFERGWKVNLPAKPDENELLSDEYYIAAKAKRQGLGLVQFIGELFKLNMLIEKIMYECIIRLLGGTDQPHPEPEEVESLCRLLVTVGKPLDEGKARSRMNAIYDALDHFRQTSDLESRIKFKILDILELRRHGWVGRATGQQGPKTIQEIHEDVRRSQRSTSMLTKQAAKAKVEAELARQTQQRNRPEFGRGDARQQEWGSLPRPKADTRAGDLSKLGMVRTSSSSGLGPQTSVFNSMRTMSSRGRTAAGNTLQREGSGQSSRTGTPGASTPPSVTSMNSFEYLSC
jgi:translation initiation factor 4G